VKNDLSVVMFCFRRAEVEDTTTKRLNLRRNLIANFNSLELAAIVLKSARRGRKKENVRIEG
jgi:hypothetical protein